MFENQESKKIINNLVIFKGVLRGIVALIVLSIIKAIFDNYFFSLEIGALNTILLIENIIIITYLGFYVARNVDHNGWLNGGLSGLIYIILLILIGTISMPISLGNIIVMALIGLIIGSIGGIIGINF